MGRRKRNNSSFTNNTTLFTEQQIVIFIGTIVGLVFSAAVIFYFVKYPAFLTIAKFFCKFIGLLTIVPIIFYLLSKAYFFSCKGIVRIGNFFMVLIKSPKMKLFGIKFTDYFAIIDAFINLFIGILYLIVGVVFVAMMIFMNIFAAAILDNLY
tara:strand:+ start:430 stop:888 length:459 start_codon:yes stop_codon:yes gene_type:complete